MTRPIKAIIEDMERLTESAQVDDASHSRHDDFQQLLEELRKAMADYGSKTRNQT